MSDTKQVSQTQIKMHIKVQASCTSFLSIKVYTSNQYYNTILTILWCIRAGITFEILQLSVITYIHVIVVFVINLRDIELKICRIFFKSWRYINKSPHVSMLCIMFINARSYYNIAFIKTLIYNNVAVARNQQRSVCLELNI